VRGRSEHHEFCLHTERTQALVPAHACVYCVLIKRVIADTIHTNEFRPEES
jgi:hypothetical protein